MEEGHGKTLLSFLGKFLLFFTACIVYNETLEHCVGIPSERWFILERERNYLIDAIKCLACFGVVMAHMATKSLGDEFYYIEAILGRCGVPIFFMISG